MGLRDPHQLGRLDGIHGERFLADDVLPGFDGAFRHAKVELVRRGNVDRFDGGIVQDGLEVRISDFEVETLDGLAGLLFVDGEDAANVDGEAAQRFDVYWPNKAGSYDCNGCHIRQISLLLNRL